MYSAERLSRSLKCDGNGEILRIPCEPDSVEGASMTWVDGVIAAFDIETTGIDPVSDELVQVAVLQIDSTGQVMPESWSSLVSPGRPIPPEAVAVHGITSERAAREGIALDHAIRETLRRLQAAAASGIPVVVYNAPFDLGFMKVRAARLGISLPELAVIDPLVCDRAVDTYRRGSRTLGAVAAHYGCAAEELHDAAADAAVSVAVARAMGSRYAELGSSSLDELHRRQVVWHRAWAENFASYLRGQGRDASSVDPCWPLPRSLSEIVPPPETVQLPASAAPAAGTKRPWWRFW